MLKTFSLGGVHPAENKLSAKGEIEKMGLPEMVTVHTSQHIGAPAKVLVKRGDSVKVGQVIAESAGFVSANIHSPVSGVVHRVDKMPDASGYRREAVMIKVEDDVWHEDIDTSPDIITEIKASKEEIIKRISDAGIVGLGGATFPAHVKLSPPPGKKAEVLLINGVECEPYLTADHRLMLERGEELIIGIKIIMKALEVDRAIIGIEANKPDAIKHLKNLISSEEEITVETLKVQYPQGGEKQLISACLKREVPSGKLPIEVGAVVHNVGTAVAVYEAVQKNKPLVERVVTVTGLSVEKPGNYLARVGIPISMLVDAAGGVPEDTGKVISGGPMMGKAVASLEVTVTKGTSGILLMPDVETRRKESQNCIRCSKCVSVCPMGLSPYLLMALAEREMFDRVEEEKVMDCIECGSCSYICPSNRPLLDYVRLGKIKVGEIIRSRTQAN